jgi:hypothetical protein
VCRDWKNENEGRKQQPQRETERITKENDIEMDVTCCSVSKTHPNI